MCVSNIMKSKPLKNLVVYCFDMKILTAMLVVLFITKLLRNAVFQESKYLTVMLV